MAVLGFDLQPLRSAIAELGQGVRQGAQQAQPAGPGGQLPGGGDYLGYLAHLAPPPAADFRPAQAAPQAGPGDFLGQLGQLATGRGAFDAVTPTFAGLGQLGTGGPGQFMADLAALADKFTAQKAAAVQTVGSTVGTTGGSTGAGGYTGTGTASDNAGITGQKVDQFIASKFADSPLVGKGQLIVDYANARGVSVPEAVGIFWKESGMGTTAGPGWNIAGLGGAGNFAQYATIDDAIRGAIDNLASDLYRGKSVQDHIGYWFVGPQRYAQSGLNADDGTGGRNGTVGDYLSNFIAPTYAALGAPYNQAGTPQPAGGGGHVPVTAQGFAFPVVGYNQPVQLHWGSEQGGSDIMAAEGTPIVSMGAGTITDVSPNSLGGNTVTMKLDNGLIVYMAHMRDAPLVQAGQRVGAGTPLGYVGTTGNAAGGPAHLHIGIGYDIQSGSGPTGGLGTGFNAVDWLNQILQQAGAATGGGGAQYR